MDEMIFEADREGILLATRRLRASELHGWFGALEVGSGACLGLLRIFWDTRIHMIFLYILDYSYS